MAKQIKALCIISEYADENGLSGYSWRIVHPDYLNMELNEYDAYLAKVAYSLCLDVLHDILWSPHFIESTISRNPEFRYVNYESVVDTFEIYFQIETDETK